MSYATDLKIRMGDIGMALDEAGSLWKEEIDENGDLWLCFDDDLHVSFGNVGRIDDRYRILGVIRRMRNYHMPMMYATIWGLLEVINEIDRESAEKILLNIMDRRREMHEKLWAEQENQDEQMS